MAKDENRSIFRIMDKIIDEVNKTKTIFTILIVLIIIPLGALTMAFIVFDLAGTDYYLDEEYYEVPVINYTFSSDDNLDEEYYEEYPDDFIYDLYLDVIFLVIISVVIGFAIRQLIILNKLTKKYSNFKKEQKELDKKLDESDKE